MMPYVRSIGVLLPGVRARARGEAALTWPGVRIKRAMEPHTPLAGPWLMIPSHLPFVLYPRAAAAVCVGRARSMGKSRCRLKRPAQAAFPLSLSPKLARNGEACMGAVWLPCGGLANETRLLMMNGARGPTQLRKPCAGIYSKTGDLIRRAEAHGPISICAAPIDNKDRSEGQL